MLGDSCALYIPLGEFLMFLAILPIGARVLSMNHRSQAAFIEGGAAFALAIALGYALAYLTGGQVEPTVVVAISDVEPAPAIEAIGLLMLRMLIRDILSRTCPRNGCLNLSANRGQNISHTAVACDICGRRTDYPLQYRGGP